jgi:hypothetical protein
MVIFIWIVLGVFLFFISSVTIDSYLEFQYKNYKDDWIIDGRSRGFGFNPNDSSLFIKWVNFISDKDIPYWVGVDPRAIILVKRLILINQLWLVYLISTGPIVFLNLL